MLSGDVAMTAKAPNWQRTAPHYTGAEYADGLLGDKRCQVLIQAVLFTIPRDYRVEIWCRETGALITNCGIAPRSSHDLTTAEEWAEARAFAAEKFLGEWV